MAGKLRKQGVGCGSVEGDGAAVMEVSKPVSIGKECMWSEWYDVWSGKEEGGLGVEMCCEEWFELRGC